MNNGSVLNIDSSNFILVTLAADAVGVQHHEVITWPYVAMHASKLPSKMGRKNLSLCLTN
jgi:hypothetical protein